MAEPAVNTCGVDAYIGELTLVAVIAPALIAPVVTIPVKVGEAIGAAPKLVKAAVVVVAPVPPLAIATVPVIVLASATEAIVVQEALPLFVAVNT